VAEGTPTAEHGMFEPLRPKGGFDPKIIFPAVILVAIAILGGWAIGGFMANERERELTQWQVRLGIVADSRAAEVERWLEANVADLTSLADNESVQLYVGSIDELAADPEQQDQIEGFRQYLRNLLLVAAARGGFGADRDHEQPSFNQERIGAGGIVIVDMAGVPIASSPEAPPFTGALRDYVQAVMPGQSAISPLRLDARQQPTMTFVVPLFAVQSDRDVTSQIGRIVGVKQVASELFPLLRQPGEINRTTSTVLLSSDAGKVYYLSPLERTGQPTDPLGLTMERSTPALDAAFAIEAGSGFAADKKDYRGRDVLVAARAIAGSPLAAPWVLIHSVEYGEALGPADARARNMAIMLALGLLLIAMAIVAVWRHGSSRRASEAAEKFQHLAQQFEAQKDLLQLVTDSQPTSIFILDKAHRYRFANAQASRKAGITPAEMLGKEIEAVLGPALAKRYTDLNDQANKVAGAVTEVARLEHEGQVQVLQSEHIPLQERSGAAAGVLTVERDITDVVTEREKRARTLQNLVKTLVGVVDRRDPFAANHSMRVAKIAASIAREMGLTEVEIDTTEIAGNLLNLGKIMIPPEVLAKTGDLTEEERRMLRNTVQISGDILQNIEFDGPVVETLRQAQERWDGSGQPRGLKAEAILVTARIIAVANALVGMISDRAFRQAMSIDSAIEILFKETGKAYDRRVVAALVNYLDNRDGRTQIAEQLPAVG